MEYVDVDIYGKCGLLSCPVDESNHTRKALDCRAFIASQYMFFFAFENSLCREYITEKFFLTLNYNIIPVVFGLGDYGKYVPASAFINVLDFKTAEQLAGHLLYVSEHPSEYNKYFAWRKHISYHRERWPPTHTNPTSHTITFHTFCDMCIRLNMNSHLSTAKLEMRDDIESMFDVKGCKRFKINEKSEFVTKFRRSDNIYCDRPTKGAKQRESIRNWRSDLRSSKYHQVSSNKKRLAQFVDKIRNSRKTVKRKLSSNMS